MIILPKYASAFWPFSKNADAAVGLLTPNIGTPALAAATNSDPNPNKGLADNLQTSGDKALLAYTGPSGTIADVASTTPSDRISVYVVRTGDTLSEIASMFNVSINTIIWANDLSGARDVHPGDTLIILPVSGLEHKIAKGDTLKSLAKKYGGDADEIAQFNGLDSGAPLAVGTTIIIPGGELSVPTAAPRSGTAPQPYQGGGGSVQNGYYSNPIPGGLVTQGIHGWNGIDIGAARGTPIHAAANGTVIIARNNGAWNGGYGNYVVITHSNGSQTLYAHMSSVAAYAGQSVTSGQVIGYVGRTGKATGFHLHFEVRGAANPFRNCRAGTVCAPQ
jgi:LysM repeat protein